MIACDFLTVETILLRRFYVLFFIAHANSRVWLAGPHQEPDGRVGHPAGAKPRPDFSESGVRFLNHDRGSKYSGPLDEVFRSQGIRVIKTPARAPKANAIAERTVRAECLDWLLILNRRDLEHVLRVYVDHYNRERPHRSLTQKAPMAGGSIPRRRDSPGDAQCRDRLGGLIHEYYEAAA